MSPKKILAYIRRTDGNLKNKTLRAGIWVTFSAFLIGILSLVRSILLARLLSPEIFGLWAICMIVIRGINVFTETGFGAALIQRQDDIEEARDTTFTLMVLRGFLLALLALAMAPVIAAFFENSELHPLISALALAFVFTGFQNINVILHQKELNFRSLTHLEQAQNLVNFVLVVTLAYLYQNIWALVIGHVASAFLAAILTFVIIPGKPRFGFNKRIAWELFHYGKYITGITIVIFVTSEIDNAVIGKLLGMEALGYYVLAYTLASLPATHFSKILSKVLFPAYSMIQNDPRALEQAIANGTRYVALVTIPVSLIFVVFAEEIIGFLYGERWLPAASALGVLAIAGTLRATSSLYGYFYNAIGKPNISFLLNLAKLIVIAAVIVPATLEYGIRGTAVAITVPLLIQFLATPIFIARLLETSYWSLVAPILKYSLIAVAIGFIVEFLKASYAQDSVVILLLLICLAGMSYLALCLRDFRDLYFHLKPGES